MLFWCLLIFSKHPFLKSSFKNKMKQFGSWSGSMICRAWSEFKLFSKVSADGSDRQNAHKTSKFKNAAVVHYIVQILLYILFMSKLAPIPVFLVIVHAFCRLLIFAQNIFFEIILSNIILCIPMSNNLYHDQARLFVEPDLGPNC